MDKPYVLKLKRPGSLLPVVLEANLTEVQMKVVVALVKVWHEPPIARVIWEAKS